MVLSLSPKRTGDSVRSVERAFDLLSVLSRAGEPVGLSALARASCIPKATAQRLLGVLERLGLVQRERGGYLIGPAILPLAGAFLTADSLARAALPVLEELAHLSGETTSLQVRQGFDRVVIQRVQSPHSLSYTLRVGRRLPLHLGACSQILAGAMPEDELNQLLERVGEIRFAEGVVLTRTEFLERLELARRQGYAVSFGEREAGVVSVAAPVVRTGRGVIAAVALTGPANRIPYDRIGPMSLDVRRAASEIGLVYSHS
ncbi:MAG TPA: IclR family transcriptional regulator [Chloroflexota bacterium]